ncbi:MAG: T9SS type A sorting domain-containing protein, partial [Bacteroidota bacterium]
NFGLSLLDEGILTTSWYSSLPIDLPYDAVLFSLNFEAKQTTRWSEAIHLHPRYLSAEAYHPTHRLMDLALDFQTAEPTNGNAPFELLQNQPNPFQDETVIRFALPEASTARLRLYDLSGRTLRYIEGDFAKGWNEIIVQQADLNATGVLYYQLDTPTHSGTKKMIVLR